MSIEKDYFNWMLGKIEGTDKRRLKSHFRLLKCLHEIEFEETLPMDVNRYEDGIDLRYRFAYEAGLDRRFVASEIDTGASSILEVMVALALKCEEHIMDNNKDDRMHVWFWNMVKSLGLYDMTDDVFNRDYVEEVIDRFIDHKYEKNGKGGLFTIDNFAGDMRKEEIWYQMMYYLNQVIKRR